MERIIKTEEAEMRSKESQKGKSEIMKKKTEMVTETKRRSKGKEIRGK